VIIVLSFIWAGLTETAAIAAVALNKLPIATVTVREGARSLSRRDGAHLFACAPRRASSHLAAAACAIPRCRRPFRPVPGLEGRAYRRAARATHGVGFEIGVAFQLFDVTRILAYALAFVAVMLAVETLVVQPLERHIARWRPRTA
jgi:NitT/TauT family transport system permease protein